MIDVDAMIQAADLESMLVELGLEPVRRKSKRGFELYINCFNPNHDDNKRKMSMAESGQYKGLFNCWSCHFQGNIIQIAQCFLNFSFQEALAWMQTKTGVGELLGTESLIYRVKREKLNYGVQERLRLLPEYNCEEYRSDDIAESFRQHVRCYLGSRRITQETCSKYGVDVGVHSQIGRCIVTPVIFKGRCHSIFFCEAKDGGAKRYPQGAPQGEILFNYDECIEDGSYVMVESILDVLMIDSLGLGPAMACFTNMVSSKQLELLKEFPTHAVFPDMDSPRGWDLVTRMVGGLDKSLELILPPDGKDPGDCEPWEIVQSYAQRKRYSDWEVDCFISNTQQHNSKVIRLYK